MKRTDVFDMLDVGVSEADEPYPVMEYLDGESLAAMLDRTGPISLPAACAVLEPVLSALNTAHEKGIVHRDLKPENIFLSYDPDGEVVVKLIDFGISKLMSEKDAMLTRTGALVGTPAFIAPEQILNVKAVDQRTDIYAIGVVLYKMLTGRAPFFGEHYEALICNVVSTEPTPPKEAFEGFPEEATALVMQCLSKAPADRPQSAGALQDALATLTGYQHRRRQLNQYTSGVTLKAVAGGELGPPVRERGANVAKDILAELTPKMTPA